MRETVAAFEQRTGLRYAPDAALRALGRPLAPDEACPTLFRYPGPEGLRDFLFRSLRRLAPAASPGVWLSSDPRVEPGQPDSVRVFGTVAVLEPLRLSPCASPEAGAYRGANLPVRPLEGLAWVAPSLLDARLPWDELRSEEDVRRHAGPGQDAERSRVVLSLNRYLEELASLRRAGATGPEKPWCALPESDRRELLDRYGVAPSWTAP